MSRQAITILTSGSGSPSILYTTSVPVKTQLNNCKSLSLQYSSGSGSQVKVTLQIFENFVAPMFVIQGKTVTRRSR